MPVANHSGGFEPPPAKADRWRKILLRVLLLAVPMGGIFALVNWMLDEASSTYIQPDAVFYPIGNQPVMATVLTRFAATSTGSRRGTYGTHTTYGTDHIYAAAYALPTGRQLWKTTLKAPDNQGRTDGDMLLLGQSARYLFYVRNGLFALDKHTGRVVAGPGDYGPASAKLPHGQVSDFPSGQSYRYDDSLRAVLARGTDGLYYAVDAQTLRAQAYVPPPVAAQDSQGSYDGDGGFNLRTAPDYAASLTDVYDDGRYCLALLDDQDTVLLAHDSYGVAGRGRTESVRRRLYRTASNNKGGWELLNQQLFLFGGLLTDDQARFRQPADSIGRFRSYQSLRARYPTPYAPLRLPDGGFLLVSKTTIEPLASVLLTAVSATGAVRWQARPGIQELSLRYLDRPAGKLYLFGPLPQHTSSRLQQVQALDLRTGQLSAYSLRASNPWW